MKKLGALSLVSFLLFTSCLSAVAKKKEKEQEVKPATGFAIPHTKVVKGAGRFENATCFTLMACNGIRKVDAKAPYERLQAAVAANEMIQSALPGAYPHQF